jgi:Secretion system C-terminal sorting domain
MKKTYLSALLIVVAVELSFAQNLNNHWQLGTSDVNFTTNPPTVTTVANNGQYGNASISDDFGNLLFYTDGHTFWNKNHAVMTNGNLQSYGTISNIVIVPNPMNSSQYYVFKYEIYTCLCLHPNSGYYGYNIIEFNSSNPNGIVLSTNTIPLTYNGILNSGSSATDGISNTEGYGPLTVAKNSTGDGYWVIAQSGNGIYSYKMDINGLNLVPVISNFTAHQIYNYDTFNIDGIIGAKFKMTNDNSKLIGLEYSLNRSSDPARNPDGFYKLTFNSQTGAFSNYTFLTSAKRVLSFETSQNSTNLFYTQYNNPAQVASPNRNKGEVTILDLNNSLTTRTLNLFGTSQLTTNFSDLQKDKYGNILVTSTTSDLNKNKYFHKIDSQDTYASASVSLNFVSLNVNVVSTLPQLIPELVPPCITNVLTTTNVPAGIDKKQASSTIKASNIISSGANGIYHAGSSVTLKPGFIAASGSKFRAYIAGCTNTFTQKISVEKTDVLSQNAKVGLVKLYPNPNTGIFTIDLGFDNKNEIAISIYDAQGKAVYNSSTKTATLDLSLPNLTAGLYVVKLRGNDYNETLKFIKE